jgi:putative membrane protein
MAIAAWTKLKMESKNARPSDYLANERTFLAWIRTGIALIAFGFVIAKFAIFLDILKNSSSLGAGTVVYGEVMIILGALTIAYGTYNYLVAEKQIESDEYKPKRKVNVIFSILVIAIVVAMSFLLLKV